MCIIFEIWSLLSHRTSHTLFCSWFYVCTSGWLSVLTLAVKLCALTTKQTAGIPSLLQAVLWPCQVVCLHWWLQRLCLLTSKSTGMLADKDCQSVEALQLEGFSDKIMRCKACLAVNHGDALLALRKPSGLFRHCECSELRKVWCRSHNWNRAHSFIYYWNAGINCAVSGCGYCSGYWVTEWTSRQMFCTH